MHDAILDINMPVKTLFATIVECVVIVVCVQFQFFSILVHYFTSLFISECPPSRAVYIFFIMNIVTFIALFTNFYNNSYRKRNNKTNPAVSMATCCQPKLVNGDAIYEQSKSKHC